MNSGTSDHRHGHRQRLRERFLKGGSSVMHDYEMVELLLFLALPRRDVKPLAKQLIAKFGDFPAVIQASSEELRQVDGIKDSAVSTFHLIKESAALLLQKRCISKTILSSWKEIIEYCQVTMAELSHEQLRILFMDSRNRLLETQLCHDGTINRIAIYPREIVRKCLNIGATGLLMVHNHPSGDPTPSQQDIEITKSMVKAVEALDIHFMDHLVIAREGYISFRNLGLI